MIIYSPLLIAIKPVLYQTLVSVSMESYSSLLRPVYYPQRKCCVLTVTILLFFHAALPQIGFTAAINIHDVFFQPQAYYTVISIYRIYNVVFLFMILMVLTSQYVSISIENS